MRSYMGPRTRKSLPDVVDGWEYRITYRKLAQIHSRRPLDGGVEKIFLDADRLEEPASHLRKVLVSHDHTRVAYLLVAPEHEQGLLYLRDIDSGTGAMKVGASIGCLGRILSPAIDSCRGRGPIDTDLYSLYSILSMGSSTSFGLQKAVRFSTLG
ncbi:hypothetical protein BDK51DRAFT_51278 [Blyttiomyces helicus]|uniref:Uncharacterized protein n=1 Tax=Blyttiomyces helicus TaxID=388810 RepID=A0A4V1IS38_9FUNG|nr:hypothetical protein BDK51DRAFT_51278 [Blyttiomyces helicus]|eukprot:RKO92207.1 hypothetical protein BDK51DRAFT_51278 [Blyttiomyces helicus]